MLSPQERMKLDELRKKEALYQPLTQKELDELMERARLLSDRVSRELLISSEIWNRMCSYIVAVAQDNARLLMEIDYLKKRKTGGKA